MASAGKLVVASEVIDECIIACNAKNEYELQLHASQAIISAVTSYLCEYGFTESTYTELPLSLRDNIFLSASKTEREAKLRAASTPSIWIKTIERWKKLLSNGQTDSFRKNLPEAISGFQLGQLLTNPPKVLIFGRPNAGKSTLFNTILGFSRVITSHESGTTHDIIWEPISLNGITVMLADCPGFGGFDSWSEILNKAAASAVSDVDLVISVQHICDTSTSLNISHPNVLQISTKSDLASNAKKKLSKLPVSAKNGDNITRLLEEIGKKLDIPTNNSPACFPLALSAALREALVRLSEINPHNTTKIVSALSELEVIVNEG